MRRIIWTSALLILIPVMGLAQSYIEEYYEPKKQVGFVFTMAETGSGLGGFIVWPLGDYWHGGFNLDAFFIRDSKQFDFYYFGTPISINKENNVYLFDAMVTVKRRFFADEMDEGFRPFLTGGVGLAYGMNFPEASETPEGLPLNDQFVWAPAFFLGSGVDITVDEKFFVGIRAQYRILPFSEVLGEQKNHSMFELRFELGQRL